MLISLIRQFFKMRFLNLFKKKRVSEAKDAKAEAPSIEQKLFAEIVLEVIAPTLERYDFVKHIVEVKTYSTNIVFRKSKQYIEIHSTNYPLDYPYHYNILLGEGDSENFSESDWNSIALWQLAKTIDTNALTSAYDFPNGENVKPSIEQAIEDLLTYGGSFLKGDLTQFNIARSQINQQRRPYKILSQNKKGVYVAADDPKSNEQKQKYS